MVPDEQASPNPPGDVYDMQSDIDGKFPTPVHFATYVLESPSNDVLTRDVLLEFKQNKDRLLDLDSRGELSSGTLVKQPYLFTYYDPSLSADVVGINSLIDRDFICQQILNCQYVVVATDISCLMINV